MRKRPLKIDCKGTMEARSGDFLQLYFATFTVIQSTYSRIPSNGRQSHLMHVSLCHDNHPAKDRWESSIANSNTNIAFVI